MNVFAFSTSRASAWRWRIVDLKGDTVEESSASFPTIAEAMAAGTGRLRPASNGILRHHYDRHGGATAD